jgi:hypothetical protein
MSLMAGVEMPPGVPTIPARTSDYAVAEVMAAGEKGPAARRRPKPGREAYCLYVERPGEGGNEADGPFSTAG